MGPDMNGKTASIATTEIKRHWWYRPHVGQGTKRLGSEIRQMSLDDGGKREEESARDLGLKGAKVSMRDSG